MNNIISLRNIEPDQQGKELDRLLIPNEIYDITLTKDTEAIKKYFYKNPKLLANFIGYNSALKLANQLASDRKCGCFYELPWVTRFQFENKTKKTILPFSLQVKEYRYMIRYWYPSPDISYMRYLSSIALQLIQVISRYLYNLQNNLDTVNTTCTKELRDLLGNRKALEYFYSLFYLRNL
jgi:hypothetical protein